MLVSFRCDVVTYTLHFLHSLSISFQLSPTLSLSLSVSLISTRLHLSNFQLATCNFHLTAHTKMQTYERNLSSLISRAQELLICPTISININKIILSTRQEKRERTTGGDGGAGDSSEWSQRLFANWQSTCRRA